MAPLHFRRSSRAHGLLRLWLLVAVSFLAPTSCSNDVACGGGGCASASCTPGASACVDEFTVARCGLTGSSAIQRTCEAPTRCAATPAGTFDCVATTSGTDASDGGDAGDVTDANGAMADSAGDAPDASADSSSQGGLPP